LGNPPPPVPRYHTVVNTGKYFSKSIPTFQLDVNLGISLNPRTFIQAKNIIYFYFVAIWKVNRGKVRLYIKCMFGHHI
jgi:hypothetical protein